jgi:hypothetical protein
MKGKCCEDPLREFRESDDNGKLFEQLTDTVWMILSLPTSLDDEAVTAANANDLLLFETWGSESETSVQGSSHRTTRT